MSKTILCPYCFRKFENTDAEMQCQNEATKMASNDRGGYSPVPVCPTAEDQKFNDHWGTHVKTRRFFKPEFGFREKLGLKPIQDKPCPYCGSDSHTFVCPNCHNALPVEMIEKGSEIISVIGGPASGKSNYIVALIHELKKYAGKLNLDIVLMQVGRTDEEKTSNKYKEAKRIIFEERMALPKTQETTHPIPWIVRLESFTTKKAIYLVFYDTAGETFRDISTMQQDAKYFKESKGVIVVFDSLAIPKIHKILQQKLDKKIAKGEEAEGSEVLQAYNYNETWNSLSNFAESGHKELYKRPFAFVFTKFDAVMQNQELLNCDFGDFTDDNGVFKNNNFVKTGRLDLKDIDNCSKTISECLKSEDVWDEYTLANTIENKLHDNARFFGVSALGPMSDEVSIESDVVNPIRVVDPLLWILYKLGDFGIQVDGNNK